MTDKLNIDGLEVDIVQWNVGAGHQGQVHLGTLSGDSDRSVAVKFMPFDDKESVRTQALCALNLPVISPAFAAPIVAEDDGRGQIVHVSPYVEGVSWEDDIDRSLPQCLEMALQYVSLMALLEEHGISHGDRRVTLTRCEGKSDLVLLGT